MDSEKEKEGAAEIIKGKAFMSIDGRRRPDRRTLHDRRRPGMKGHYKGHERRFRNRRKTKYIDIDDKIVERFYDRRRDERRKNDIVNPPENHEEKRITERRKDDET
ncbi:MAG: hypothetical protein HY809_02560 [Nitrospirae bacterium]|nr:hypothetical protein [Nitrospirota bacterium]